MIRLTDTDYVNPHDVVLVSINYHQTGLIVHIRGGAKVEVPNDYGKGPWATQDRLIKEINAAIPGPEQS